MFDQKMGLTKASFGEIFSLFLSRVLVAANPS